MANQPFWSAPAAPPVQQQSQTNPGYSPYFSRPYNPGKSSIYQLPGRVCDDFNSIKPNEIPMDGSVSIFPSADYSVILAKAWNQQGTIDTIRYEPVLPQQTPPAPDPMEMLQRNLNARMDKLEGLLSQLIPQPTPAKSDKKDK